MARYQLVLQTPRPYFAEVPYYLWGTVNYKSDGDCKCPTDQNWTWLELRNRDTQDEIEISTEKDRWLVCGEDSIAARAASFLCSRCGAIPEGCSPADNVGVWDHDSAMQKAQRVAQEFSSPPLQPFDSHWFWGSWKWIGWFATDLTLCGRLIMLSVLKNDSRGVPLCVGWLKDGTVSEEQSKALRYALNHLTGTEFETDREWVRWYFGSIFTKGHKDKYPEPDFNAWFAELKGEYGDSE